MSIAEKPVHIPHRAAPYDIATGNIQQRLDLSGAKKSAQDSLHFRDVGKISGDTGYIHIGIKSDIKQYQQTMSKVIIKSYLVDYPLQ